MPRSDKRILENKLELAKAQCLRLDAAKLEALRKARSLILTAYEAGYSQNELARIWKTNPTRIKSLIAQATIERSQNA